MSTTRGKRFLRKRLILFVLILFLIFVIVAFQFYLRRDYTPLFLKAKGELIAVKESFVGSDTVSNKFDVLLTNSRGLTLDCLLKTPKDSTRTYPTFIVLNGFRTGKQVIELFSLMDEVILISTNYPYESKKKYQGLEIAAQIPRIRQAIFKTIPALMNIVDYLYTRPNVDRNKLYIIGASLGAPFAVDVAALDDRIKAVILLYGGGDICKLIANLLQKQIKSDLLRKGLGQVIEWIIAPTEPLKYVHRISPRPLLMINGRNDESVPMECVQALYEKARQPKELVWLETQHARPRKTELTYQLEIMMKAWLIESKLL